MANPVLIVLAGGMMVNVTPQMSMSSKEVKAIACDPWYDNYVSFERKISDTYLGEPTYVRNGIYNFSTIEQSVTGEASREAFYQSSLSSETEIGAQFIKLSYATEVTLGESETFKEGYVLNVPPNSVGSYEYGNMIAYEKISYGYYTNRCSWVEREVRDYVEYSYDSYEAFYTESLS